MTSNYSTTARRMVSTASPLDSKFGRYLINCIFDKKLGYFCFWNFVWQCDVIRWSQWKFGGL